MHRLMILLVVFAFPADAADFRSVDIGASCNNVDAWEMAHGSTRNVTHADPGLEVYSYNIGEFGRRVKVRYLCHSEKFFSGHYDFPIETWAQAVETYIDVYDSLRSIHGDPSTGGPPTGAIGNRARSSNNFRTYIAAWKNANSTTVLIIAPNQPTKPELDDWHVVIDVHGPATHMDDQPIR